MKKLIYFIIILAISIQVNASEKDARKSYVLAKQDYQKQGCEFIEISELSDLRDDIRQIYLIINGLDLENEDIHENNLIAAKNIQNKIKCLKYYEEFTSKSLEKIIENYPSSEVAYDLVKSNEINNHLKLIDFVEQSSDRTIKDLKTELDIWVNDFEISLENFINEKKEELKKIEEEKKETEKRLASYTNEPLTKTEMQDFQKQLLECFTIPAGVKHEFLDKEFEIIITVNENRSINTVDAVGLKELDMSIEQDSNNFAINQLLISSMKKAFSKEGCKILKLPQKKYHTWKKINFSIKLEDFL